MCACVCVCVYVLCVFKWRNGKKSISCAGKVWLVSGRWCVLLLLCLCSYFDVEFFKEKLNSKAVKLERCSFCFFVNVLCSAVCIAYMHIKACSISSEIYVFMIESAYNERESRTLSHKFPQQNSSTAAPHASLFNRVNVNNFEMYVHWRLWVLLLTLVHNDSFDIF